MRELLRRKIQLQYYVLKVYVLGFLKAIIGKMTWNSYFTDIEKQKLTNRLRLFKTIYFNFRTMPAQVAWKTPIWLHGKIKFHDLSGKVLPIEDKNVHSNMLTIGNMDPVRSEGCVSAISVSGSIYYGDRVELRNGLKMNVSGTLILEDHVFVSDNGTFIIVDQCRIREKTRCAFNVTFMDTDIHYMIDINTGDIRNNHKPIDIGKGNWIGGNSLIKKGTKTPNYLILAGPYACLTKDYTKDIPEYACMGGCPAKLIKVGLRRINSSQNEHLLTEYFDTHEGVYHFEGDIDTFCSPN